MGHGFATSVRSRPVVIPRARRDATKPVSQRRAAAEPAQRQVGLDEDILREFLADQAIARKTPEKTCDLILIAAHDPGEGLAVTVEARPDIACILDADRPFLHV